MHFCNFFFSRSISLGRSRYPVRLIWPGVVIGAISLLRIPSFPVVLFDGGFPSPVFSILVGIASLPSIRSLLNTKEGLDGPDRLRYELVQAGRDLGLVRRVISTRGNIAKECARIEIGREK